MPEENNLDHELLTLAAKAAGLGEVPAMPMSRTEVAYVVEESDGGPLKPWNPLEDDGDALRLAVKLKLDVAISDTVQVAWYTRSGSLQWVNEPHPDAMRAIVRAAGEIGREAP